MVKSTVITPSPWGRIGAGLLILAGSSSCATMVNQSYKYVTIHTTEQSKIICGQDTMNTIDNKAHLKVERKKEPLAFVATTDNTSKSINIKPRSSMMYWSNICFNFGIGMGKDSKNPKRYTYPDKIFINSANETDRYYWYGKANNKGELYFHLSPSNNIINMAPENEGILINTRLGFGVGIDYYHSGKQFIHLGVSMNAGSSIGTWGVSEDFFSNYVCLSNNHKIGQLSMGYGISCTNNTWEYNKEGWFIKKEHIRKNHKAFGLIFPANLQLTNNFNIGFVYIPTFYRPDMTEKFVHEDLISVNCALKIRMKK